MRNTVNTEKNNKTPELDFNNELFLRLIRPLHPYTDAITFYV